MKKYLLKSIVAFIFLLIAGKAHAQAPGNYNDLTSTSTVGTFITITPTHTGAAATSFVITTPPNLPNGLSFNTTTGIISGTPTAVSGPTTYTITPRLARNGNTFTVRITVNPQAPNIGYTTPQSYPTGTAITPLDPNNTGGAATTYTLTSTPALPAGLTLNGTTGIISGTPTVVTNATNYIIRATNATGSDNSTISIATPLGPPNFAYNTPNTLTVGTPVTLNPTNNGGPIASYSAVSLPAGLTITATGANAGRISGTPTTPSAATDYIITATDAAGSNTFRINITVNVAAPNVTYPTTETFTAGAAIVPFGPLTNTGGAVTTFSAPLPAGLTINATTGVISGTPSTAAAATNYTVSAANATNTDQSVIRITVNPSAPIIAYTTPVTLVVGTPATLNVSSTGGAVATYTDVTGLPDGLTLQNNGNITGTPTTVSAAQNYTIRATNVTSSVNTVINIKVNPAKPNISYATPVTLHVGTTVSLEPTNTGGDADSYTFATTNPTLPAGLTFSTVTGIISGTPTTVTGQQSYNITATNITGTSAVTTIRITVGVAAAGIYDWTGVTHDGNWANPLNWDVNDVQQTTNYPGLAFATDVAQVGVDTNLPVITSYPTLAAANNITIASLTFGNNNAPVGSNAGGILNLTVNGTLTVSSTILQQHSSTGGPTNLGTTVPGITTTLLGNGTITCAAFTVGDNNNTPQNLVNSVTRLNIGSAAIIATLSINVTGDFTVNSTSASFGVNLNNSDAQVSFAAGTLNVNGTLKLTNTNPAGHLLPVFTPFANFSIDLNNNNSPVLNLAGATPISIGTNGNTKNNLDFFNPPATTHNHGTVNYTGTNQRVYNVAATGMESLIDADGATNGDGYVYDNLGFSGTGTKTLETGAFKVAGNFTLATTGTIVSLANNPVLTVGGDYSTVTGSTFTNGTGAITIGGNFSNAGTTTFGTPLITFNSTGAVSLTTTATQTLTNVAFTNNGLKSLTGGVFNLVNTGILTMGGTSTILNAGAGGTLTLASDVNSTASVAIIPSGCKINGQVNVQRYLSAVRSYRLLSSPVNTGTTTPTANYNLNYVKNSVYLTGTTGTTGGFDKVSGPTLYLYKENYTGPGNTFTTSNFRDITDITAAPLYSIDGETGTFSLPTGSSYLMYFRGDRSKGTVDQETTAGAAATSVTLTATGVLNQGLITFTDLFSGNATLSSSNANPVMNGFNGIGNPYACSIDLESLGTGIMAPGITKFIYQFNQITQAFDIYTVNGTSTNPIPPTGSASRYIASGQGFVVQGSGTLSMNESAKASAVQNTGPQLLMGKPAQQVVNAQFLRLQMARDTNTTSDIIISFDSKAKIAYDRNEDALFKSGGSAIIFGSMSSDNKALAINQLPLAQKSNVIRLNVSGSAGTPYTLNMKDIKGIPDEYDIWLMDADKKDSLDLRATQSYAFTMLASDTGSYGSYRFSIVLRQNPAKAYKLISFDASKTPNKDVELVWVTQNEENYTNFTIERSTNNGKTYDVVGGVASTGAGTYSLTDKRPSDHNLYRLKQEDINDSIYYSNVIKIDFSNRGNDRDRNVNVYPNPARDRVTFAIESKGQFYKAPTYKIEITNSWGLILQQTTSKDAEWQTNVGRFMPGTYYVRVINEKDGTLVGQNKFVKL